MILVHGMSVQFLVEALNIVDFAFAIVLYQNMVEMIVRLMDPLILRLKSAMRIRAQVS